MEASSEGVDAAPRSLMPLSSQPPRTEQVVEAITRAILAGVLQPGERLVERDLAQRLAVSKTPVREALKVLSRRGLVTYRAYQGTQVRAVDAEMARQIYEVRILLEPAAVCEAVPYHHVRSVSEARAALTRAAVAADEGDLVELTRANRYFHDVLYAPCPNPLLRSLIDDLRDQVALITVAGWRHRSTWTEEAEDHQRILAAVEHGNAGGAGDLMRAHISKSLEALVSELSHQSTTDLYRHEDADGR